MAFLLAAFAVFTNAVTSVLQRIGVESAPELSALHLSLISQAIKRGIWLVGFALMLVQFGLPATALRFGQLSVVQPVLTTELLFLLLILAVWFRYRLGGREWLGALLVVGGLGGFFLAAHPHGGQVLGSTAQWVVASAILISVMAGFVVAAIRGPRWWRAAAVGGDRHHRGVRCRADQGRHRLRVPGLGPRLHPCPALHAGRVRSGYRVPPPERPPRRADHRIEDHARDRQPAAEHRAGRHPIR